MSAGCLWAFYKKPLGRLGGHDFTFGGSFCFLPPFEFVGAKRDGVGEGGVHGRVCFIEMGEDILLPRKPLDE